MDSARITDLPPSMHYIPNFITAEEETAVLSKIPPNRWITLTHRRLQTIPARLTATNTLVSSTPLPTWLTTPIVDRIHAQGLFADAPHGVNHCLVNGYVPGQGIMPHEDGPAYHPVVATVSLQGTLVLDVIVKKKQKKREGDVDVDADVDDAHGDDAGDAHDDDADKEKSRRSWRIVQEPRSLLVTTGAAYTETLHGIAEVTEDVELNDETVANWSLLGDQRDVIEANGGRNARTTRISLTYRDVKKVSTIGSKIFGKSRA